MRTPSPFETLRAVTALAAMASAASLLSSCEPNRTIPGPDAYVPPESPLLSCMPNLDGVIDAAEMRPVLDVPVSFVVSPAGVTRTDVDVVGRGDAEGNRTWTLDRHYPNDQLATLRASSLSGRWYASSFPDGQFVAPIDLGGAVEAVYAQTPTELRLVGYASAAESPPEGKSLVVYESPVVLYRFPITPGQAWTSVGEVRQQTVRNLPYAGRDTYTVRIDGGGHLVLPDFLFTQVLRASTTVRIEPALGPPPESRRQVSWLFECFGEVARATSTKDEPLEDFTIVAELRRLGI